MAAPLRSTFVTGGSSALGEQIIAQLSTDRTIVALRHRGPITASERVRVVDGSLEHIDALGDDIRACDEVVHLAGLSRTHDDAEYHRVNADGTAGLLAQCRPGQRFVYTSSRAAAPGGGAYAASKLWAETLVRDSPVDAVIVRPGEVYGTAAGEGIDALLELARRRRIVVDVRARPPVTYAPLAVPECAAVIVEVVRAASPPAMVVAAAPTGWTARDLQRAFAEAGHRVVRLPVPHGLLRVASHTPVPLPFTTDQIDRLIAPKPLGTLAELGIMVQPFDEVIGTLMDTTHAAGDHP